MNKKIFLLLDAVIAVVFAVVAFNYRTLNNQRNSKTAERMLKYRQLESQLEKPKTAEEAGIFGWVENQDELLEDEMAESSVGVASVSMVYHITNDRFWDTVVTQKSQYDLPTSLVVSEHDAELLEDETIRNYLNEDWELMLAMNLEESDSSSIGTMAERAAGMGVQPQAVLLDADFSAAQADAVFREMDEAKIRFIGSLEKDVAKLFQYDDGAMEWWQILSLETPTDELMEQITQAEEAGKAVLLTDYSASGVYSESTHCAENRLLEWLKEEENAGRVVMTKLDGYTAPVAAEQEDEEQEDAPEEKNQDEIMDEIRAFLHMEG